MYVNQQPSDHKVSSLTTEPPSAPEPLSSGFKVKEPPQNAKNLYQSMVSSILRNYLFFSSHCIPLQLEYSHDTLFTHTSAVDCTVCRLIQYIFDFCPSLLLFVHCWALSPQSCSACTAVFLFSVGVFLGRTMVLVEHCEA